MSKITMNQTKNTVSATFLPYKAYLSAHELATAYEGEIGKTDDGFFKATFANAKIAKQFLTDWTTAYEANRKVEADTPTPASKPASAQKGKGKKADTKKADKPSSTKKSKGKGNSFDFDSVKGNTKKEKNKALHAMLVGMGIADSRTPEYQSVWNARPWAK